MDDDDDFIPRIWAKRVGISFHFSPMRMAICDRTTQVSCRIMSYYITSYEAGWSEVVIRCQCMLILNPCQQ